jgi:hypothetical protein
MPNKNDVVMTHSARAELFKLMKICRLETSAAYVCVLNEKHIPCMAVDTNRVL